MRTLGEFLALGAVALGIGAGLGWLTLQAVTLALRVLPHLITVV